MGGRKHRHYENRIAKKLGTQRILQETQSQGGTADARTDWLSVEMFQRDIPKYLEEEVAQAEADAEQHDTFPLIIWRQKYRRDADAIAAFRFGDLLELLDLIELALDGLDMTFDELRGLREC